mgnify:CR=1 FL=1
MAKNIEAIIKKWGDSVTLDMVAFLDTINKTNTGNLAKSLRFEVRRDAEAIIMEFKGANYSEFVRLGVQGIGPGRNKAPGSPFKFGSGKHTGTSTLRGAIDKWVITKGLGGTRDKKGRFIKRKSLVYLISRSIYRFGIRPTNFVFPFFKRMDELTALIGTGLADEIREQIIEQFNASK